MHVFFEDDGAFKAGSVLVDNDTSLQVEAASGKRLKIKAANVLLRFAQPEPEAPVVVAGISEFDAGVFGVLSGMALIGITTSADANIGNGYTLLSIAGVILGGGEFVGGRVSPIGAVIGALTLALAASPLLTFMHIPPDWQVAANGAILIVVLAARVLISAKEAEA